MRKMKWVGALLGLCLIAAGARARAAVKDDAHFFSEEAITQANQKIAQINDQFHKDVVIDTVPAIPADQQANFDPAKTEQFFDHWAMQRAREQKVNGIYILICKDPSYLKPMVGRNTVERFTLTDSKELGNKMLTQFKQKQFDAGLNDGVSFIQSTLDTSVKSAASPATATPSYPPANAPANSSPAGGGQSYPAGGQSYPSGGHSMGIFGWIILIGVIFVVIRVLRALFGGVRSGMTGGMGGGMGGPMGGMGGGMMGGGYGGPGYGGGGGGGFGRGILGGLLGGMAGGWLYDRERNGGIFGGGNSGNIGGGNIGGGNVDANSGGGSFGDTSGFNNNDAGMMSGGDSGGGSFGDSGGGGGGDTGGGGGGDSGGGTF